MTYKINGKEYTEFDINKRCAELMGIDCSGIREGINYMHGIPFNYCNNAQYAWTIIEKCFDKLMLSVNDGGYSMGNLESIYNLFGTKWDYLIEKHKCTKLVAACICFIEINEGGAK
jgi:ribulose 1,5-bisphosphate carboxylase large subunit-like protein